MPYTEGPNGPSNVTDLKSKQLAARGDRTLSRGTAYDLGLLGSNAPQGVNGRIRRRLQKMARAMIVKRIKSKQDNVKELKHYVRSLDKALVSELLSDAGVGEGNQDDLLNVINESSDVLDRLYQLYSPSHEG